MKKIIFVLIIFCFSYIVLRIILSFSNQTIEKNLSLSPTITQTEELSKFIIYQNTKYNYGIIDTINKKVTLMSNLEKKMSGLKIAEDICKEIVNAGFYDKNYFHLGLFETGGELIQKRQINNFLNGFLIQKKSGEYLISREHNDSEPTNFALQSGPILFEGSMPLELAIKDDEPARRIVAITSATQDLNFLVVYSPDNYYSGPILSDLPNILKEVFTQENLNVKTALNLDGGSASFFYSPEIKLPEMATVGGFFCINLLTK